MNTNTVSGLIGGTGVGQIKSQALAAVTETLFVTNTGATPTTATATIAVPLTTDIVGVRTQFDPASNAASPVRTGNRYGNQFFNANNVDAVLSGGPFLLRLAGTITVLNSNGGNSLNLIIYRGTTTGGDVIATTGVNTGTETSIATGSFVLEAQLTWDSTSQLLGGQQWYQVLAGASPLYNTWKTTPLVTSVTAAKLVFCASTTWGNAAGGTIQVSEFSIARL